ncbi:MerR family transcriptional regulator [Streptomyces albofaciens JCM 4342]|uniref:MerR family transcriptional regulator n=1 Tax=Streptomyces albofaciens TaxID=66866 RepID=UPI00123ACD62|nr:MerR family transcriptional regulator [Streptomyces albofaciens]KAA6223990.1 MerR family transcriptional regulator [Streptomyces albofaciens JCM 4342]
MQIGELAQLTGASRRSIRYFEQQGLLEARRTGRGWRVYDEGDVRRVLNVRESLRAGLTVEDIRQVLPCLEMKTEDFLACQDSPDEVLAMYEDRLAAVEAKAAELARYRAELVERIAVLRAGHPGEELAEVLRRAEADAAASR